MKRAITAVLIVSSLAVTAQREDVGSFTSLLDRFQSPSGNILCEVHAFEDESTPRISSLSCTISQSNAKLPPKTINCEVGYFHMMARGKAIGDCTSANNFDPAIPVLPYGKVWQVGGFRCDATTVRVRCVNLDKHGFELSRARQILF